MTSDRVLAAPADNRGREATLVKMVQGAARYRRSRFKDFGPADMFLAISEHDQLP